MVTTRINFGVYLNNRAAVFLEDYSLDALLDLAPEAETLGYHSVWLGDSLLARPRYDPIVTLAAIATRTRTIRLGTSILQSHMRNPVLLALEWGSLDAISHGRTILGVGVGGGVPAMVAKECAVAGVPKSQRGKVFEEGIEVLKALWMQDAVTFEGKFYRLEEVRLGYKPLQKPHPPIWIAAGYYNPLEPGTGPIGYHVAAEAGKFRGPFERVARLADGWLTEHPTPEEYRETFELISRRARDTYGRSEPIHRALLCYINLGSDAQATYDEAKWIAETYHRVPFDPETMKRWLINGDADACVRRIAEYEAVGVQTVIFLLAAKSQREQLRRIAQEIFPAFRG